MKYFWCLLKGLVVSCIITLGLILIVAIILTYTTLKESNILLLNTIIMVISIATGAIYLTMKIGEKGWLNGGIIGATYYLIILLLGISVLKNYSFGMYTASKFIISLVTGVIGGMIGINLK